MVEYLRATAVGCENPMTIERALAETSDIKLGLKVNLFPHQRIALAWMRRQEQFKHRGEGKGGIIADQMGLGKTMQTTSIICGNKSRDPRVKTTLVVCLASLLDQWEDEILSKTIPGRLNVVIYHGRNRQRFAGMLPSVDVVITSYGTLASEYRDRTPNKMRRHLSRSTPGSSSSSSESDASESDDETSDGIYVHQVRKTSLFDTFWYRVVLDEAHLVRNHQTIAAKAVCELEAEMRWTLTGTPIMNKLQDKLQDMFIHLKFIGISPCKEWVQFHDQIGRLEKSDPESATERMQVHHLETALNVRDSELCMLRRRKDTKVNGHELIKLPPKTTDTLKIRFSPQEQALYTAVQKRQQAEFSEFCRRGTVLKNWGCVWVLMMRLRQMCNHPYLIQQKVGGLTHLDLDCSSTVAGEGDCSANSGVPFGSRKRRLAEADIFMDEKPKVKRHGADRECLEEYLSEKGIKVIVFSHFTSFLDIVSDHLREEGIPHLHYNGRINLEERSRAVRRFSAPIRNAASPRVMLISIKCGGAGLNLTAASKVISLDPAWNIPIEEQAFDRVHRIGQDRPVEIRKFVVKNTFESRMLQIQNEKQALADGALGEGMGSKGRKWTVGDLARLFGLNWE